MVPSSASIHFWWLPPVQSEMSTAVPAPLPWPRASRHFVPYTRNSPAEFGANVWLAPPLQSQISAGVALVCAAPVMSRHRPDWLPVSRLAASVTVPATVSMPHEPYQLNAAVPPLVRVIGSQTGSDAFRFEAFQRSPR